MIARLVFLVCLCFTKIFGHPTILERAKTPFSIEEAILQQLYVSSFSGKWISDVEIEYKDKVTHDVKVLNVAENKTYIVLDYRIYREYNATSYEFSPDRKFVLLSYNESSVYRHSKAACYVVYSLENKIFYHVFNRKLVQGVSWGPLNNALIFIESNNIYYMPEINKDMIAYQITTNGEPNIIYNGLSDWVYEEEVLESEKAYWFSPDGDQLIYLTLYDNKVPIATYFEYGEPGKISNQYMKKIDVHYPKTGSTNPDFELWVVSLKDMPLKKLLAKSQNNDDIFYDLTWVNYNNVYFLQTNRVQNESKTYHCVIDLLEPCELVFEEKNKIGWVNRHTPLVDENLNRFLKIEAEPVEAFGNFKHLVLYYSNGTRVSLTAGFSEVTNIIKWDKNNKVVYYEAAEENDTTTTQVFAVSETNNTTPICLSCQIKSPEGSTCKDASASFSELSSYVYFSCNGPDPKVVYLYKNRLSLGSPLLILEDNAKLRHQLRNKLFPETMNLSVSIPGPFNADVRLLLPPDMDKSGKTKYPLLIYVYGGPESKGISSAFKLDWGLYLSTNQSVIYGIIDGRNTKKKGEKMLYAGYRALGTYEIEDQLTVTKYIQNTFPFVDSKRTGIWGWSYGGYATTKILERDTQNVFKCGIAVAPVADWLYYDSVYTERYMGLPQENEKNYKISSVLNDVSNIRNKEYLLIHGNADDNVHYQNAMMITKLLERQNIPFEIMSYPDENHSLTHVKKHLYYTMDRFWKKCFKI